MIELVKRGLESLTKGAHFCALLRVFGRFFRPRRAPKSVLTIWHATTYPPQPSTRHSANLFFPPPPANTPKPNSNCPSAKNGYVSHSGQHQNSNRGTQFMSW